MPKVLCTLPNASEEISGVKFVSHSKGMLSEEISDEAAAVFASIPGYEIVGEAKKAATPSAEDAAKAAAKSEAEAESKAAADAKAAERAALVEKAEGLGLKVKSNWSIERLASEIQSAEAAAKTEAEATGQPADTSKPAETPAAE